MSKIVFLFVFAGFLAMTLAGVPDVSLPPQPAPLNTTTVSPDTTTSKTTTTTTAKTTTSSTPDTTTPTTTSSTTPSTTSASTTTNTPSTTSVAPSTPTPPPGPKPVEVGNWNVTNEADNITCIIAKMAIQLNITYVQNDNKTGFSLINVPANSTATGDCGNKTQTLVLSWAAAGVAKLQHNITLTFGRNDTVKESKVERIVVVMQANNTEFPKIGNLTVLTLVNQQTEFTTGFGMSYSCAKNQMLDLTMKDSNVTKSVITVSQLRLESFHAKNDTTFSTAKDCESSNPTDIVPIAVGCALVTLVAIVLIAYLVGRRRSQARGYLSIEDHDRAAHS